ncbi:unnamed protein product [Prunus armeniaca]
MQLQHFIKEKLENNEFKAALANEELVFFTAAVDKAFADPNKWTQMSILSTAGSGIFSRQNNLRLRGEDLGN